IADEQAILLDPFTNTGGVNPYQIAQELQEAMQEGAFIAKTEEGLTKCLNILMELQQRGKKMTAPGDRAYNPGWQTARDLRFTLKVSEVIVRSALERKESR